ncbi:MAG TPA: ABC transporter substrate-binding protein, partial [Ktedonobacterales bacterium]|nr:ABC transporter substrate-binding protein [Ktedonobacterales bacterium]
SSQFDMADTVPAPQLAAAKSRPDFYSPPYLGVGTVAFNWKIAPFDNLDARLAFCEAINRDLITSTVLHGADTPSWHLVPKGMPGYNPNVKGPDGETATGSDVANAQKHWQAYLSTVNNKPPKIVYSYNTSSTTASAYAQALISGWNQVLTGANVQTDTTDWATILKEEQAKKVQSYRFGWIADYPDPQDFLTLLYSTTSSYNDNNASVPQADQLMSQADGMFQTSQTDQRMSLYNQAEQLLINQVAVCPVFQYGNQYMARTYMKGFLEDAQGQEPITEWPNVYIATH